MSDFTALYIATVFAVAFAPWYCACTLAFGLVVSFVLELP